MFPTQAHRIQTSLRSFEKATSAPVYSLHGGVGRGCVTHRCNWEKDSANIKTFEELSTQAGASLLPLLPSWSAPGAGARAWPLKAILGPISLFCGYESLSEAPHRWLGKCYSTNPISPPQDLTGGGEGGRYQKAPMVTHPSHTFQSCFTKQYS